MTEAFATCNGQRLTAARLHVANLGPWYAELEFEQDPAISGRVELQLGSTKLSGTLQVSNDGTFGLQRKARIVAGAGAWGSELPEKAYHNDAGVKAKNVAQDAAREAGETLGDFIPAVERVGADFVRQRGPARRTLELVAGPSVAWWVDYAGITNAGPRPTVEIDKNSYELLAYNPLTRIATLAIDDLNTIQIGAVLTERFDEPVVVREYEVTVTAEGGVRVVVWTGGAESGMSRLAQLLRGIAARAVDSKLFGKYRYRVLRMASDGRVELQIVRKQTGLPNILPVEQWPGVAGAHAELAAGAEVLVEFIEGDPSLPAVVGYAGKNGAGFVPDSLTFCESAQRAARQGDLVQSGGPGCSIILTPLPGNLAPSVLPSVPYLVSFSSNPLSVGPTAAPLYGAISTGSPKVKS
jgi:hypothetical protein